MNGSSVYHRLARGACRALLGAALLSLMGPATAATLGKVQGRVLDAGTAEPVGFADLLLIPADTTLKRVGGLANADGTFLLEAPAGLYTLQIRSLSYARKLIEGVRVEEGKVQVVETALQTDAIVQEEVVVEAKARQDTERALLAARKRASTVGDAVASEQLRRTPDKDAADVLRRVTGLSVSEGKYVFVRGLGERYSSTEVDGLRLASPEQNRRVLPLDLFPANLLDNVTIQKTYTADRPGEFGGGDVQVRTRNFPGARTWTFSVGQGISEGTTFGHMRTYLGSRADIFGFGGSVRDMPGIVRGASNRPLGNFSPETQAAFGRAFRNVLTPTQDRVLPNGSYNLTFGDEFKVLGRSLGVIQSASLSRSFDEQEENQRFFASLTDTIYDYAVERATEKVQLGAMSALSYRLSPAHSLHVRGLYTRSADDEVRLYEGPDHNRQDFSGADQVFRSTRLMYTERSILSGSLEGKHEIKPILGSSLAWRVSLSEAHRKQPDRRETKHARNYYEDADGKLVEYWVTGGPTREFAELEEDGWATDGSWSVPYRLGSWGNGKADVGFSLQRKDRDSFQRRFQFFPPRRADTSAPPESLFQEDDWTGQIDGAQIVDNTRSDDNYVASQRLDAGYLSLSATLGQRLRGIFGLRYEHGYQDVTSFYLFAPDQVSARGRLDDVDWLPSVNLNWSVTDRSNLRLGASRTLSRPDLNELSPSPATEYQGGFLVSGNPNLERTTIDNYDVRIETYPSAAEVLSAGFFYKDLHQPIEQVIRGNSEAFLLVPENSESGRNLGVELEARFGLGRLWRPLERLAINTNYSRIQSKIKLKPTVSRGAGSSEHPLQGQASYLMNAGLTYAFGRGDATLLVSAVGKRLESLGLSERPDVYDRPLTTLDAAINWSPAARTRLKLGARNLTDVEVRRMQGPLEYSSWKEGRSYSLSLSYGS